MVTTLAMPVDENRDERKARIVAWISTVVIAAALLLILLLIKIITPIPAFPPDPEVMTLDIGLEPGTGGDAAISGGGSNGNTGNPGMQEPASASNPTPAHTTSSSTVTDNNSDNDAASNSQPTMDAETAALMSNWNKNHGKATIKLGGNGNGDPYTGGLGDGHGDGVGPKDGGDPGPDGLGGDPNGTAGGTVYRHIKSSPTIVNPTQEEGKVVVIVHVDRDGNVISGKNQIGSATTTINSILRSTAMQSAYKIKFDAVPSAKADQAIAIEIVFTLK